MKFFWNSYWNFQGVRRIWLKNSTCKIWWELVKNWPVKSVQIVHHGEFYHTYFALQTQKAVSAYFSDKQIQSFVFIRQYWCWLCWLLCLGLISLLAWLPRLALYARSLARSILGISRYQTWTNVVMDPPAVNRTVWTLRAATAVHVHQDIHCHQMAAAVKVCTGQNKCRHTRD